MKKLGELLKEAGVLDEAGLQRALVRQQSTLSRLGDTLLELRLVTEEQLFVTLGRQLEIPIIAEQKLLVVDLQRPVLDVIPGSLAWKLLALPLLVDPGRQQISIVTAEPNDPRTSADVKRTTGIQTVKLYLAKRSAIQKVLTRYYGPDPSGARGGTAAAPADEPEAELMLADDATTDPPLSVPPPPTRGPPPPGKPTAFVPDRSTAGSGSRLPAISPIWSAPPEVADTTAASRARNAAKQRIIRNVIVADPNRAVATLVKRSLEAENYLVEIATTPDEILNLVKAKPYDLVVAKGQIAENIWELERRVRAVFPMTEFRVVPSFGHALLGDPVTYNRLVDFTFDGFDLLLALIERGDGSIRRRAQTNARYAKMVGQKLLLPRKSIDEVYLAAYLDALGDILVRSRGGDAGDRVTARRLAAELFRAISPPYDVETVLDAVEERVDGSGPRGLKLEQIPIGARILAVVLGYNDAKGIEREQLQRFLREMSGRMYENRIVETFLQILRSEEMLGEGGGRLESAGRILIADKDVAHTSTLELRLVNEGYSVSVVGDGQTALDLARQNPPSLVISEIALPRMDGFNLCMTMKADPRLQNVPFVFVSGKGDEFNSNKALEMGADDFIGKPVNVEFLVRKLQKFIAKPKAAAADGGSVRGRLLDLGLIELVQTLSLGMKTVKVELEHDSLGSAAIYIGDGRIMNVTTRDKQGDEAFYQIATWTDGTFTLVNGQVPKEKNIGVSNDFLILEALRRLDEAAAQRT